MYSNIGISVRSKPIHKGRHIHIHPYPNRLEDHPSISIRVLGGFIHIHPYPRVKWISADIHGYPYPCQSLIYNNTTLICGSPGETARACRSIFREFNPGAGHWGIFRAEDPDANMHVYVNHFWERMSLMQNLHRILISSAQWRRAMGRPKAGVEEGRLFPSQKRQPGGVTKTSVSKWVCIKSRDLHEC